jgi:hypothetical protein
MATRKSQRKMKMKEGDVIELDLNVPEHRKIYNGFMALNGFNETIKQLSKAAFEEEKIIWPRINEAFPESINFHLSFNPYTSELTIGKERTENDIEDVKRRLERYKLKGV